MHFEIWLHFGWLPTNFFLIKIFIFDPLELKYSSTQRLLYRLYVTVMESCMLCGSYKQCVSYFRFQRKRKTLGPKIGWFMFTISTKNLHRTRWYVNVDIHMDKRTHIFANVFGPSYIYSLIIPSLIVFLQQVQNFGDPFFLVIHEDETLGDVKARIQKKLQVPDDEFSKVLILDVHGECEWDLVKIYVLLL